MSIQGNINSLIGMFNTAVIQGAQAKAIKDKIDAEMATTKTGDELNAMLRARGLSLDDNDDDIVEAAIAADDDISDIKARLGDTGYKTFKNAVYKDLLKDMKETPWQGVPKSDMDNAQYKAYRNLANLKLSDINKRASYAQGVDPYQRETVNGVPKFQHSTDDLSNDDWGAQG